MAATAAVVKPEAPPTLVVQKHPRALWYKDVGGKRECMNMVVRLEGNIPPGACYTLETMLYFESGKPVPPEWQKILAMKDGPIRKQMLSLERPVSELKFRIEKVSTAFQSQKFLLQVHGVCHNGSAHSPLGPIYSTSIESKAKPKRPRSKNRSRSSSKKSPQDDLLERVTLRLEATESALTNAVTVLQHCVDRLSKVESKVFPNTLDFSMHHLPIPARHFSLGSTAPLAGAASSVPIPPALGLATSDELRQTAEDTATEITKLLLSDMTPRIPGSALPDQAVSLPPPPLLLKRLSSGMLRLNGRTPSLQRLSSKDWPIPLMRIKTEDIQLFLGSSVDTLQTSYLDLLSKPIGAYDSENDAASATDEDSGQVPLVTSFDAAALPPPPKKARLGGASADNL